MLDTVSIVLPIIFFSEIGDGANCVCGGARPLLDMGSKGEIDTDMHDMFSLKGSISWLPVCVHL